MPFLHYMYILGGNDKMHKKLLSVFVALGVTLAYSGNALASPLQEQYNQSLQQYQNSLKDVQAIEDQIEGIDNQMGSLKDQISSIDKKIDQSKEGIEAQEKQLDASKDEMDKQQKIYDQRLKAMYMNGNVQYLAVLLNCNSFSDFVSDIEAVERLMQYDKNIVKNFNAQREDIEKQKQKLVKLNDGLNDLQSQNKKKLEALNEKRAQQDKLMAAEKAEEAKHSSDMQKIQSAMDAEKKKIEAIQVPVSAPSNQGSSSGSSSKGGGGSTSVPQSGVSGEAIVKYAASFIGTPYVYGGSAPGGFDCSGLVQYVYAHFGISLPRTSEQQVNAGAPVTGDLEPGDLLFFEPSSSGPGHVGIYAGDNTFIEAPHTGANVRLMPVRPYCAARRIIR